MHQQNKLTKKACIKETHSTVCGTAHLPTQTNRMSCFCVEISDEGVSSARRDIVTRRKDRSKRIEMAINKHRLQGKSSRAGVGNWGKTQEQKNKETQILTCGWTCSSSWRARF